MSVPVRSIIHRALLSAWIMHKYRNVRQEITRIGYSSNVVDVGLLHLIAYMIEFEAGGLKVKTMHIFF